MTIQVLSIILLEAIYLFSIKIHTTLEFADWGLLGEDLIFYLIL